MKNVEVDGGNLWYLLRVLETELENHCPRDKLLTTWKQGIPEFAMIRTMQDQIKEQIK